MKEVLDVLELEVRCLQHCIDDKGWCSTKSDFHKETRKRYKNRLAQFKKAIEVLTNAQQGLNKEEDGR